VLVNFELEGYQFLAPTTVLASNNNGGSRKTISGIVKMKRTSN